MIAINAERCKGCGACVDACPSHAMYIVDHLAVVDRDLCSGNKLCITACPNQALAWVEQPAAVPPDRAPVPQPEPAAVQVRTRTASPSLRSSVLPVVGAALVWAGREIVPWLAEAVLDNLAYGPSQRHRSPGSSRGVSSGQCNGQGSGRGKRRRRRRRGA